MLWWMTALLCFLLPGTCCAGHHPGVDSAGLPWAECLEWTAGAQERRLLYPIRNWPLITPLGGPGLWAASFCPSAHWPHSGDETRSCSGDLPRPCGFAGERRSAGAFNWVARLCPDPSSDRELQTPAHRQRETRLSLAHGCVDRVLNIVAVPRHRGVSGGGSLCPSRRAGVSLPAPGPGRVKSSAHTCPHTCATSRLPGCGACHGGCQPGDSVRQRLPTRRLGSLPPDNAVKRLPWGGLSPLSHCGLTPDLARTSLCA